MLKKAAKVTMLMVVIVMPVIVIPQVFDPLGVRYEDDVYQVVSRFQCANNGCARLALRRPSQCCRSPGHRAAPDPAGGGIARGTAGGTSVRVVLSDPS